MLHKETTKVRGSDYVFETGVWAKQAGGSVLIRWGKLVVMANATSAKSGNEDLDFFPLTIEYREKFYAAGRIPGGFIKREARPTEREILNSRLCDRPLRPLFPETFKNETQIFVTLLSSDGKLSGDVHTINAASAALMISPAPFQGPVGGVRVARVNGEFILFPTPEEIKLADINLALAGTESAVTMIEGNSDNASEEDMLEALRVGHEEIKRLCQVQKQFAANVAKEKIQPSPKPDHSELEKELRALVFDKIKAANAVSGKHARQSAIDEACDMAVTEYKNKLASEDDAVREKKLKIVKHLLEEFEVEVVRDQIFNEGKRADGRKLDEIRDISIEVGVLPGVHGSALFTRGETQSLGVATLGTDSDSQSSDDVEGMTSSRFYLHYNFPPYSVGEVRRLSGPGRREIGHGKLAENALVSQMPNAEKFPYVVRVVSEILESNGSSSMATVCSGCLAMMDAGVPFRNPVAGIAMGLITEGDKFAVLTDIAGLEDHFGDMDFKVAGSEKGITAFQMDTKVQGISFEVMAQALKQAKDARLHILNKMKAVIEKPREELSENAPRISTIQIDRERIGELIGPGGKNIRAIIEKSKAEINVNDDGIVTIATNNKESAEIARNLIEGQFADAEMNAVYDGTVKRIADFGAFIEIMPGREGLCHISKISDHRVNNVRDELKEGQEVKVKVIGIDRQGKIALSIKDAN
ncbi:MAG: polyribonucleotide nucleotidyltransferase [Leptospiraceae bacterium]|nr:polyribonucleotide nucleotidyltransferase [Leptospiraceae bacterium]